MACLLELGHPQPPSLLPSPLAAPTSLLPCTAVGPGALPPPSREQPPLGGLRAELPVDRSHSPHPPLTIPPPPTPFFPTGPRLRDSTADFGFGIYNDHHYHLGYFLYAMAVLARLDPCWGRKHMPQADAMVADFMTLSRNRAGGSFTRLWMFDLWKLHSWAGGLTEFADGRNQESTSEAVNAYYSAALVGLSYGDAHLVSLGATLAAQTWWHVRAGEGVYEEDFAAANHVVGVLWANKRDSGLWFAPPEWKEPRSLYRPRCGQDEGFEVGSIGEEETKVLWA
ncbi:probable endo-1,3(4)-beta-glucanase ARB_01444 [Panicum virgatum]|uniref:probable endo-1,3(4)-beta-glucanase ARB_01444 n=1 Tax=Panicum virgatum TaxID=38727 RepID=UPI0019D58C5A|nr:probable endo-1,3(4)-beta-glucanase ARB_01444 [Panicum virgatum]